MRFTPVARQLAMEAVDEAEITWRERSLAKTAVEQHGMDSRNARHALVRGDEVIDASGAQAVVDVRRTVPAAIVDPGGTGNSERGVGDPLELLFAGIAVVTGEATRAHPGRSFARRGPAAVDHANIAWRICGLCDRCLGSKAHPGVDQPTEFVEHARAPGASFVTKLAQFPQ